MFTKIRKRNGRIVEFDATKITNAIAKAGMATGEFSREIAEKLTLKVLSLAQEVIKNEIPSVEEIQDVVEEVLLSSPYRKTAKAYIIYRDQHAKIREITTKANVDLVDQYLEKIDWQVNENSNMTFSLQGLNNYISSEISKIYWLNKIYPPEVKEAHINGDFHIHDLNSLSVYCVGWDLLDLLMEGFRGVSGKAETKPAKHFRSALGQIVNFFYTLQGEAAGAQAFSNFDTLLAPFVRYDNLSYKEVKQALQEFVFNVNVPTRVGFQTPFSNCTLDLKVPDFIKDQPVIIGGEPKDVTYKDFQEEMDIINRAFLEVMIEGDAKGRVFTFPIPTYNITKDFDWNNPNISLLWEVTAKYGIPYFSNFINSSLSPEDARSMCLFEEEEILVKDSKGIKKRKIKEVVHDYGPLKFDQDGWVECNSSNLRVLSLNYETGKTEWTKVKNFLKVQDKTLITIETEDGKQIKVSEKHLVPILTSSGLVYKLAKDINPNDYLLSLKGSEVLNNNYQRIDDLILDEKASRILGYFTADGNYLFEARKNIKTYKEPKGLQFTFNAETKENLQELKELIKEVFQVETKEKKDPRYNSYYLYIYDAILARKLYNAGFKKYGHLPDILFNSPKTVLESFLYFYFKGDGYERDKEIHINDRELSRDLVILYSLIGKPVTYTERKNSQVIHLQHKISEVKINGHLNTPTLAERIPGFLAKSTYLVPGLSKSKMVGVATLEKYEAQTEQTLKIKESDYYIVRVKNVMKELFLSPLNFYDFELENNHLFVHSLGTITHNCCRLRLDTKLLARRGGGLFGSSPLTGSIGVVTINMPRLGYLSKDEDEFIERLERLMVLAKQSLEIKRKVLERFTERDLYPYSKYYLREIKRRFGEYWKNHFSTIGLVGMNEACLNLFGKDIASREGQKFTLKVLNFMRNKLIEFQEATDNNYNLEATPAESTSYRLARIDKEKYPEIICANEEEYRKGASPFYTNSTQLPVNFTDDIFEALDLQDDIQTMYTGGTVFHIFVGETLGDPESIKTLIKKICQNYRLPYLTITPTFSVCPSHGYIAGEYYSCPQCGAQTEVYSRVVGYLRPVSQWNRGKQEEFKIRKTFKIK